MEAVNKKSQPVITYGIAIGLLYCILIFIQNQFFYQNPFGFGLAKLIGYLIIIGAFIVALFNIRKSSVDDFSFKKAMKYGLILILIAEIFYLVFSTIYTKYIDPEFFDKMKSSWEVYFRSKGLDDQQIEDSLAKFDDAGKLTAKSLLQSFGFSIIIDSIFMLIIAGGLRKRTQF